MTARPTVAHDPAAGSVDIEQDGRLLWRYRYGGTDRPHIHPLATIAGHVLTSDAPPDHPWHHGLWFTIKYVNGENFWEELAPLGSLRHQGTPTVAHDSDRIVVSGTIDWVRPDADETVVITEVRSFTHVPIDGDTYAIDVDISLVPVIDVVLDRTPFTTWGGYGGLAFRGRGDWHDTRILLADGSVHERVVGLPADWLDLSGPLTTPDGDVPVGITMAGRSADANDPVPWYGSSRSSTYGDAGWSNFFNAAVLWDGPIDAPAGTPLRLRLLVLVHDGVGEPERLAQAFTAFVDRAADIVRATGTDRDPAVSGG